MSNIEPTVRSRELGEGLRQAMRRAGLNGKQAAYLLGWSESWVSKLLTGKRGATVLDVVAFLGVCRVKGPERDRLLALCQEQHTPGWFQQHGSRLPTQLTTLIDHENRAVSFHHVQPILVPGPLQTGEYARAVISGGANMPPEEVDDRVAARLARRKLFSRELPPRFTFYLHESVLRTPVGGRVVMREQLHHLLYMSTRPYLVIRVIPLAIGAHAAMAGAFTLMEFAESKPVVYLEGETSCVFLEEPAEIVAYRNILMALDRTALGEGQSRKIISVMETTLYGNREDHDDRA